MPLYPPFSARPHLRKRWGLDLWVIADASGEELLLDRLRGDIIERWTDRERNFFGFPHETWRVLGFSEACHDQGIDLQDVQNPEDVLGWNVIDLDHGTVRCTSRLVRAFHPAPDWWVQQTMNKLQRLPFPKSWGGQ